MLGTTAREEAERKWAAAARKLSDRLFELDEFIESFEIAEEIRVGASAETVGQDFMEELQLHRAMIMQKLGRIREANDVLADLMERTTSQKHRLQAEYIKDVINSKID